MHDTRGTFHNDVAETAMKGLVGDCVGRVAKLSIRREKHLDAIFLGESTV